MQILADNGGGGLRHADLRVRASLRLRIGVFAPIGRRNGQLVAVTGEYKALPVIQFLMTFAPC